MPSTTHRSAHPLSIPKIEALAHWHSQAQPQAQGAEACSLCYRQVKSSPYYGSSEDTMDYIFSHFCGIFLASLW